LESTSVYLRFVFLQDFSLQIPQLSVPQSPSSKHTRRTSATYIVRIFHLHADFHIIVIIIIIIIIITIITVIPGQLCTFRISYYGLTL
jgi:hypothetical protein